MKHETEQENFWAGEFGDEYIARNTGADLLAANISMFGEVLRHTARVSSVLELGANVGLNLRAIAALLPSCELAGVEINERAVAELAQLPNVDAHHGSLLEFDPGRRWDFVFTKGVLIHIAPEKLPAAYETLYRTSGRYVCVAEYYNPTPVEIPYRGHTGKLFKRDFAGDLLEHFADLRLVDYGFRYHRDPTFPQDDISWFLLQKG